MIALSQASYRKMKQNLLVGRRLQPHLGAASRRRAGPDRVGHAHVLGAILMSVSTIVVAFNAQLYDASTSGPSPSSRTQMSAPTSSDTATVTAGRH